ncbi:MAG: ABC transporter substrate-binding protein, partial [Rickettsiaceae bacterium]|nr:ABC transporter substrate-binding protein [Rickettsiaceae bacterium]
KILNQFVDIASNQHFSSDEKVSKVKPLLLENLDVEWMAKFTLGRHRKGLSQQQIGNFTSIYRSYLLASYSGAVKQYNGQKVQVYNIQNISDTEYMVKTKIVREGQDPLLIDYGVRVYPGALYKVFDVVTEGVSMITSQQSEFTNIITSDGFDSLGKELSERIKHPDSEKSVAPVTTYDKKS